jgi:hypothetical protein
MLFVGSAVTPQPLCCFVFIFLFLCFSGEARFLFYVLSRFLQPACLFYIALSQLNAR